MRHQRWILFLLILIPLSSSGDFCTKDDDVVKYLLSRTSEKEEEVAISSIYKLDFWEIIIGVFGMLCTGYFEMTWTNATLAYSHLNPCNRSVRIDIHQLKPWVPHVYFSQSWDMDQKDSPYQLLVHENGNLTLEKRLKIRIPCRSSSDEEPFGNTTCQLSYFYTNIDHFNKVVIEPTDASSNTVGKTDSRMHTLKNVNFFSNKTKGQLVHHIEYTIYQNPQYLLSLYFIPTFLFLIPPWLSLLLGPMAITRCIILMSSLILLSIKHGSHQELRYTDSSVSALTLWDLFNYIYVIGIVIELIIITLLASIGRSKTCCFSKQRSAKYEMEPLYEEMNDLRHRKTRRTRNCCRKTALFVDIASFFFFGFMLTIGCYGFYTHRPALLRMIEDFDMESLNFI